MSAGRRSATAAGSLIAFCAFAAAAALLVELVLAFAAPDLTPVKLLPFFDRLRLPTHGPLTAAIGLSAACLVLCGILLLRRSRYAPLAFVLLGWGGLAFVVVAAWPGERLRFMMDLAVTNAKRQGAPPDVTIWELVPQGAYVAAGVFALVWVFLLVAGTVHVLRQRAHYTH